MIYKGENICKCYRIYLVNYLSFIIRDIGCFVIIVIRTIAIFVGVYREVVKIFSKRRIVVDLVIGYF